MAVCSALKERGIERVEVGTEATNYNAINVYAKAGFKVDYNQVSQCIDGEVGRLLNFFQEMSCNFTDFL